MWRGAREDRRTATPLGRPARLFGALGSGDRPRTPAAPLARGAREEPGSPSRPPAALAPATPPPPPDTRPRTAGAVRPTALTSASSAEFVMDMAAPPRPSRALVKVFTSSSARV